MRPFETAAAVAHGNRHPEVSRHHGQKRSRTFMYRHPPTVAPSRSVHTLLLWMCGCWQCSKNFAVVFVCGNAFVWSNWHVTLPRAKPQKGVVTRGQVKGVRRYKPNGNLTLDLEHTLESFESSFDEHQSTRTLFNLSTNTCFAKMRWNESKKRNYRLHFPTQGSFVIFPQCCSNSRPLFTPQLWKIHDGDCQGTFITPSSEAGCSPLDRVHPENCTLPLYLFIYFIFTAPLSLKGRFSKLCLSAHSNLNSPEAKERKWHIDDILSDPLPSVIFDLN